MKKAIAIVMSDLHARQTTPTCRKDNYFETMKRKLKFISSLCEEKKCNTLVDCGDLFDTWKSTPKVESMLLNHLPEYSHFLSVAGNHEMPYHSEERIYESSFNVIKIARGFKDKHEDFARFHLYNYSEGLPKKMPKCSCVLQIAVWHGMVFENNKPKIEGVHGFDADEVCKHFKEYDFILTGHNHETFICTVGKTTLINPGSVMRSSINQIDHKPCVFIIYDDKTFEKIFIPTEQDVFRKEMYEVKKEKDSRMEAFVEWLKTPSGMTADFKKNVSLYIEKNKIGDDVKNKILSILEG